MIFLRAVFGSLNTRRLRFFMRPILVLKVLLAPFLAARVPIFEASKFLAKLGTTIQPIHLLSCVRGSPIVVLILDG